MAIFCLLVLSILLLSFTLFLQVVGFDLVRAELVSLFEFYFHTWPGRIILVCGVLYFLIRFLLDMSATIHNVLPGDDLED